ncbi:MAG: DUF4099 domain-containing protein [Prevotellaceae bacterium]|nr:DUF4099 domain-containing protein [Prevotellaceae bacterium]
MRKKFDESEIPYDLLAEFGITQDMVDDFPQTVMDLFLCGLPTPLLPIKRMKEDGSVVHSKASIFLTRTEDGVDVLFASRWDNSMLDDFSIKEQDDLRNGKVLLINHPDYGRVYVQLDDSSNRVMISSADIIDKNLTAMQHKNGIAPSTAYHVRNGSIETFTGLDGDMTMGIDLHTVIGIRTVPGTQQNYKEQIEKERLPEYNFGLYGCWISKDGKTFSNYVKEENYSADILAAEQAARRKNVNSLHL